MLEQEVQSAGPELITELERLDRLVNEVSATLTRLRAEKAELEHECERLRAERNETVARLSRLIEKVDLLRGGA